MLRDDAFALLRRSPLRAAYHQLKSALGGVRGQSDEGLIIAELAANAPKTFVEFGFHPTEYNCSTLARSHAGLLIDGDPSTVRIAKRVLTANLTPVAQFLTLDNLGLISDWLDGRELGALSIDVDGNDYWFLEALLPLKPAVISVEYNASFGLEPVTVPYDPSFDRHQKHPSGWYHGASITALAALCARSGYGLAAVSAGGQNAFFTPAGALDPHEAWLPNALRNKWSKTVAEQQWQTVRSCPLVAV